MFFYIAYTLLHLNNILNCFVTIALATAVQRTVDASVDLKPIYAEMKQFNPLTNPNAPKSVDRVRRRFHS